MTDVTARLEELRAGDLPVHGGRTLAYVYDAGLPELDELARDAVAAYAGANGLDPKGPTDAHGERIYMLTAPNGQMISFQSKADPA